MLEDEANIGARPGLEPEAMFCVPVGRVAEGRLQGKRDVVIEGCFRGCIDIKGRCVIAAGAIVEAACRADTIEIAGTFRGTVEARQMLRLKQGAMVVGDLQARQTHIEDETCVFATLDSNIPLQVDDRVQKPAINDEFGDFRQTSRILGMDESLDPRVGDQHAVDPLAAMQKSGGSR